MPFATGTRIKSIMNFFERLKIKRHIFGIKIRLAILNMLLSGTKRSLEKSPDKSNPAHIERARSYVRGEKHKEMLELMLHKFTELLK